MRLISFYAFRHGVVFTLKGGASFGARRSDRWRFVPSTERIVNGRGFSFHLEFGPVVFWASNLRPLTVAERGAW